MFDQRESKWFSRFIIEVCFHVPILDFFLFVDHYACVLNVTRTVWFYILFCFIQSFNIVCSYNKVIKVCTLLIVIEVKMLFIDIRIATYIKNMYIYIYIMYIYIYTYIHTYIYIYIYIYI